MFPTEGWEHRGTRLSEEFLRAAKPPAARNEGASVSLVPRIPHLWPLRMPGKTVLPGQNLPLGTPDGNMSFSYGIFQEETSPAVATIRKTTF